MAAQTPYPPVGRCIYCGATKPGGGHTRFGDEHIVPFAFGGNLVLPEASCRLCEQIINRDIENPVLRQEWGRLRDRLGWPTRTKADRAKRRFTFIEQTDGVRLRVPLADHSTPVLLYRFAEANILSGFSPASKDANWTVSTFGDLEKEAETRRKYPLWNGVHSVVPRPYEFARLVAKIGHAYACAELGADSFTHSVTDLILGKSDDYFYRVGGALDLQPARLGSDHWFDLRILFVGPTLARLIVGIRMFAQMIGPQYYVAVGEIDLMQAEHLTTFEKLRTTGRLSSDRDADVLSRPAL